MGAPLDPAATMGPLVSRAQQARVLDAISQAERLAGVTVHKFDVPDSPGYFAPPTVLERVPEDAAAWTEEIFGPVLCVRAFRDDAEAVAAANARADDMSK